MRGIKHRWGKVVTAIVAISGLLGGLSALSGPAHAATGSLAGSVTFSQNCVGGFQGLGTGITFDGTYLWYSCYTSGATPDLLRANPKTGLVTKSYDIANGLGSIAYDKAHNVIWAGFGNGSDKNIRKITLDASKQVIGSSVAFDASATGGNTIDDGLAYDGTDNTLYISPDTSVTIFHYTTTGTQLSSSPWAGSGPGCYNSGLAIGGNLLFEGSDGCSHVWVAKKSNPAVSTFDFSTVVAGDPNFRDEGLSCDNSTFGKDVMWSKEAYSPARAHAFEVPARTCGTGGQPTGATGSIFETEFLRCNTLHVGYNRFTNGTVVKWTVSTNGVGQVASGQFTAIGGGKLGSKTYHFLNIPLGITLPSEASGIQSHMHFYWANGGRYVATRDPGC